MIYPGRSPGHSGQGKNRSAESDFLVPGESIVLFTRQHLMVLGKAMLLNIFSLALLPLIAYMSGVHAILLLAVLPLFYLLRSILLRHRRVYVITDRRVIQQQGFLSISAVDVSLDKINNVHQEQSLAGRLMHYGNVKLETASEEGVFLFESVPNPRRFKNAVLQQLELHRTLSPAAVGPESRVDIPKLLEELASLRDRNVITAGEFEEKKRSLLSRL